MEAIRHIPVLPDDVLATLAPQPGEVFLDATLGRGGHAALLLPQLGPGGMYIGLDLDPGNAAYARERLEPLAAEAGVRLAVIHRSFAGARQVLAELGIAHVDGVLADLGFASNQVDDPQRGLSFMADGPLDMRLDPTSPLTAATLLATLGEKELADLIFNFGEERFSRRIARKIVEARARSPIESTGQLAELIRQAYGPAASGRSRIHPATRTFQALRIAVNGELDALDQLLSDLPALLAPGGRAALISFHSLEDRPVKQAFGRWTQPDPDWPAFSPPPPPPMKRLTGKPRVASDAEIARNPRARSAKLRAVQRVAPSAGGFAGSDAS